MIAPRTTLFVYGTLKRGGPAHAFLAGQVALGTAETASGYALYELDGYPGLVAAPDQPSFVRGELWEVDARCLAALDRFEGVHEGLYRREPIALRAPHESIPAQGYVYARTIAGRPRLGSSWDV